MLDWERSAKTEAIYNNVEAVGLSDLRITEKQQPLQHTGGVSVKNRKHRAAEVCLCLLCFLLLTAVIVLCVCFTSERKQLNLLRNDKNQLRSWLYEQDQRADNIDWIYYDFSFYYISSEKKNWSDSSRDCQQRGTDLVIINSTKEQDFLQKIAVSETFWIGVANTDGVWKWIDGTTIPHWSRNDSCNCGVVGASKMYCSPCDSTKRWICKRTSRIIKP